MTLLDHLRGSASKKTIDAAIHFRGNALTYAGLEGGANAAARVLRAHGVGKGDRVLLTGESSIEYVLAHLGILKLGAVCVPVNPAYRSHELSWILSDSRPRLVIADRSCVENVRPHCPEDVVGILTLGEGQMSEPTDDGPRCFDFYQAVQKGSVSPTDEMVHNDDPALLLYTSGTTGRPKGASLSHGNLEANAQALVKAFRWTENDRLLHMLPLFHIHGLVVGLHAGLLAGGEINLLGRFDPDIALKTMVSGWPTLFMGVPTMYIRLLEATPAKAPDLPSMRLFVSGSAPLPPHVFGRFEQTFGHRIMERYGTSETLIALCQDYDGEREPGSVGRPLEGVEVRLEDDDGNEVKGEGEGEILVGGTGVGTGYWNRSDATEAAYRDGWFRTGDIAKRNQTGEYFILGRTSELILSGGHNIYPREVEEVLLQHEDVEEAAVFGTEDNDLGEAVTALIKLREGATPDEDSLAAHCRELLASYKKPRSYRFATDLPRNAMGKLVRERLKEKEKG